ncbi:MAG: hypothetical protein ACR2MK_06775 [Solirubrobacteraceae bacterium]
MLIEREPGHGALGGIDDQQLVDVVGGVEGELVPGVVAREMTLCRQRCRGNPGPGLPAAMKTEIRDPAPGSSAAISCTTS